MKLTTMKSFTWNNLYQFFKRSSKERNLENISNYSLNLIQVISDAEKIVEYSKPKFDLKYLLGDEISKFDLQRKQMKIINPIIERIK